MLVIRILRVLRVARVFKLARYSSGLQMICKTMRTSGRELSMLIMFLLTGIIFFSTILYFLEREDPSTSFTSIPAACWWCVVTMTTVGYGDMVPRTTAGKLVATMASVSGIMVLAFPISMIVEKFSTVQEELEGDANATPTTASPAAKRTVGATGFYAAGRRRKRMSSRNSTSNQVAAADTCGGCE